MKRDKLKSNKLKLKISHMQNLRNSKIIIKQKEYKISPQDIIPYLIKFKKNHCSQIMNNQAPCS